MARRRGQRTWSDEEIADLREAYTRAEPQPTKTGFWYKVFSLFKAKHPGTLRTVRSVYNRAQRLGLQARQPDKRRPCSECGAWVNRHTHSDLCLVCYQREYRRSY